jgi:hypothetical protein
MNVNGNQGNVLNYERGTLGELIKDKILSVEDPTKKWAPIPLKGDAGRY